jgi:glutamate synthase (NADPH/NADH) small chain
VVKKGSEFKMDVDIAVVALGTTPNPLVPTTTKGLDTTKKGTVVAEEATGKTTKPGVWAGGDVVTGSATVISAMGAAKRAVNSMDAYLKGK